MPDNLGDGVTLGVEEEFLLVDPVSFEAVPYGPRLVEVVPQPLRPYLRHELIASQVEIATPVCRDLDGLRDALATLRRGVQQAAKQIGCRVLTAGTGLVPCPDPPPLTEKHRYQRIGEMVGELVAMPGVCGCHVHVGVADRELAIEVLNHVRPYLPILQAIGANSPFVDGRDTGYASWRSIMVGRWPGAGPAPKLESLSHFDEVAGRLQSLGVILDLGMLYWYARPSKNYPTVELRVSDVCATVADVVLVAGLSRALVRTALRDARAGRPAPDVDPMLLDAAHWRAAREGLEGDAIDPLRGEVVPAWEMVNRLMTHVAHSLVECGDFVRVRRALAKLRKSGCGATRQRMVFARRGDIRDVGRYLLRQSALGTVKVPRQRRRG